ncbi:hypothetical protein EYR41_001105 [Orbilia oligospora]|uniref:Uncharacterized protein n=1 Tax=Orbilia oligospora TaxID=2813651 RepID=A0A8H2HTV5_ORBOL|nr:hypothetical protein TWF132_000910 [Orbilia oligospora]TGJ74055.1 hypothetical protein EYR41_001105 [Orbilia oligospora]
MHKVVLRQRHPIQRQGPDLRTGSAVLQYYTGGTSAWPAAVYGQKDGSQPYAQNGNSISYPILLVGPGFHVSCSPFLSFFFFFLFFLSFLYLCIFSLFFIFVNEEEFLDFRGRGSQRLVSEANWKKRCHASAACRQAVFPQTSTILAKKAYR